MKKPLSTETKSNRNENFSFSSRISFFIILFLSFGFQGMAQDPVVTVRFANPDYDCNTSKYCLDVEFHSDTPNLELQGMNVRFWYDDDVLEFSHFDNFQGGYGEITPAPELQAYNGAGTSFFGFGPIAERFSGNVD